MKLTNNIYTDGKRFLKKYNITNNNIKKINIEGSFAYYKKYKNYFIVARDHLGCKKIFWGTSKKGEITFSDNFIDLYSKIKNTESIRSCPAGVAVFINKNAKIIKKINIKRLNKENYSFINLKNYSNKIKKKILFFLLGIKKLHGNKVYVCLSGGLDSTIIAYLAKKIFKNVVAVSCSMLSDREYKMLLDKKNLNKNFKPSDDFKSARKISKELGIKFEGIYFPESNCIKDLKKTMYACQDWRDYNVHCAILNFQIAKKLISHKNYNNEPVLTGDLMNEYLADYKSEKINGVEYYPQMKQLPSIKQRYFIRGLESSDRENGIFNFFKIPIFQPYSFVDMYYKHLPKKYLNKKKIKELLNGKIVNKRILNLISKKKN